MLHATGNIYRLAFPKRTNAAGLFKKHVWT